MFRHLIYRSDELDLMVQSKISSIYDESNLKNFKNEVPKISQISQHKPSDIIL